MCQNNFCDDFKIADQILLGMKYVLTFLVLSTFTYVFIKF